ncbi:hypothetical protein LCGC14_1212950 [marine sediment metagenome]|uniref:Uncharacterized protein n=1 Tax=marine sediment metagenome TaxID=412755 RepID=A0A0F9NVV0_9ZZZZ
MRVVELQIDGRGKNLDYGICMAPKDSRGYEGTCIMSWVPCFLCDLFIIDTRWIFWKKLKAKFRVSVL